jgi:hypothetical protein
MPEPALSDFKFARIKFQLQESHFQHNPGGEGGEKKTAVPPTWDSKKSVLAVLPPEAKMLDVASEEDYCKVKTTTSNKGKFLFHYQHNLEMFKYAIILSKLIKDYCFLEVTYCMVQIQQHF